MLWWSDGFCRGNCRLFNWRSAGCWWIKISWFGWIYQMKNWRTYFFNVQILHKKNTFSFDVDWQKKNAITFEKKLKNSIISFFGSLLRERFQKLKNLVVDSVLLMFNIFTLDQLLGIEFFLWYIIHILNNKTLKINLSEKC